MKRISFGLLFILVVLGIFFISKNNIAQKEKVKEKPLARYTFENLKKKKFLSLPITLGNIVDEDESIVSQMFYFSLRETISGESKYRKISGLINVPKVQGTYPIIVMMRGFVPKEIYSTGIGTQKVGEFFARNGFITISSDFLGYGNSDNPSRDSIEERFQTYTTALNLLSSLDNLNSGLTASYSGQIKADSAKVGIWGHSNGGHIALSVLEITGKNYPTVLWAPVSKPFPYSIFFFMDEFDDHGKALRKVVADFEADYNIELYSPSNFYSWINAPIQIHQGTEDEAVPLKWSDNLVEDLEKLGKEVEYFVYPGADHNLLPDGWSVAVQRSLDFYKAKL